MEKNITLSVSGSGTVSIPVVLWKISPLSVAVKLIFITVHPRNPKYSIWLNDLNEPVRIYNADLEKYATSEREAYEREKKRLADTLSFVNKQLDGESK